MAYVIKVLRYGNEIEEAETRKMLTAPKEEYTKSLWSVRSLEKKPVKVQKSILEIKNIELANELNEMKAQKNAKDTEHRTKMARLEQWENNQNERYQIHKEEKERKLNEKIEKLKRTWQDHEDNVNKEIKLICQEEAISFIEEWHHEKNPIM